MSPALVVEFRAFLAAEGTDFAKAKLLAFDRIVEALRGPDGLPTQTGLRQLERGQFDSRLGAEWKPVFLEAYRQWLGFLLDHRVRPRHAPLTFGWWISPPPGVPVGRRDPVARLASPLSLVLVLLLVVGGIALPRLLAVRTARVSLERSWATAAASLEAAVHDENAARTSLRLRSTMELVEHAATQTRLESASSRLQSDLALLAERTRRAEAVLSAGMLAGGTDQIPP